MISPLQLAVEVPRVFWDDIGGQSEVKQRLKEVAEWPLKYPEAFTRMGISPPTGVLLYGPPGCSKTLMARALATESGMNFIAVKGPELLSKWVGESERALQSLFRRARSAAPTIVFFDEVDALAGARGDGGGGSTATERVLSQLLTELDGLESSRDVITVAATNRPDMIDPALLRPGRLDRLVYVRPPDRPSRAHILEIGLRGMPRGPDIDINLLSAATEGFSGAEMVAVCREAALDAIEEDPAAQCVSRRHLEAAVNRITPQITQEMCNFYESWGGEGGSPVADK
jgi:AAA family ATPase